MPIFINIAAHIIKQILNYQTIINDFFKTTITSSYRTSFCVFNNISHYFTDKNSNSFKFARIIAIILTLVLMVCGSLLIAYDDFSQDQNTKNLNSEISMLKEDLNHARDSVGTLIKISGKTITDTLEKLKSQQTTIQESLNPFIEIAKSKYPNLSQEMGLQNLQFDLTDIKKNITDQSKRRESEEILKKTPPNLDFGLMYDKRKGLALMIYFKNKIPILINYAVKEVSSSKILVSDYNRKWRINPNSLSDNLYVLGLGDFSENVGVKNEPFKIKLTFSYESYYFDESQDFKLKVFKEKYYILDIQKGELKEL